MPNWFLTGLEESLQFLRLDGSPVRTLDVPSAVFRIRRLWTKFMGVGPIAYRKRSAKTGPAHQRTACQGIYCMGGLRMIEEGVHCVG